MKRIKILTKSGVYKIIAKSTKDLYVGSASNLSNRKSDHFRTLKLGLNVNPNLQIHFDTYGLNDLKFIIIEFCSISKLRDREQFYLDKLKPTFNIHKCSKSPKGRIVSKETRKKISKAHMGMKYSDEFKEKLSLANIGKILSKETKQKIAKGNLGKHKSHYGKPWSEARRNAQKQ